MTPFGNAWISLICISIKSSRLMWENVVMNPKVNKAVFFPCAMQMLQFLQKLLGVAQRGLRWCSQPSCPISILARMWLSGDSHLQTLCTQQVSPTFCEQMKSGFLRALIHMCCSQPCLSDQVPRTEIHAHWLQPACTLSNTERRAGVAQHITGLVSVAETRTTFLPLSQPSLAL